MKAKLDAGEITKDYYKQWRITQLGRGKRWEAVRDSMAERLTNYNQVAASYINDTTPSIYSLNHNFSAYEIESASGVAFNIVDEQTVKGLLMGDKQVLPFTASAINVGKDNVWNQRKIQNEVLNGILTGKSIDKIAAGMTRVTNMNYNAAVRNARTAVTGAQNAGREESYKQAEAMGIELLQEWLSARDSRVRDSHAHLDGVRIKVGEKFPNGCEYPGDPKGPASEVYNCRCTLRGVLPKYPNADVHVTGNTVETYKEWERQKLAKLSLNSGNDDSIINEVTEQAVKIANITFTPATTLEEADDFLDDYGIKGGYVKGKINLDVANLVNKTVAEFADVFGDNMKIRSIVKYHKRGANFEAAYSPLFGDVFLNNVSSKGAIKKLSDAAQSEHGAGAWTTGETAHFIRHELGHALHSGVGRKTNREALQKLFDEATKNINYGTRGMFLKDYTDAGLTADDFIADLKEAGETLSAYGYTSVDEMVAESVAEYMAGQPREFATTVVNTLMGW